MKKFLKMFSIAAACLVMVSCNNGEDADDDLSDTTNNESDTLAGDRDRERDADFLSEAYYNGLKEIEKSKAAQKKSKHKDVKSLADMMVKDHTDMGDKIKALASKLGITLEKDSLSTEDRDDIVNNDKTGADFDREYADEMVDDHEKAIRNFEDVANDNNDKRNSEVKALANEALPKLRNHLEMAKAAKDKLKS